MLIQQFFLYFVAGLACGAGFLVIRSRSPVHSVLALIFSFVQSSLLLLILEMDVLALIFLIVYVGAIAILFLFVVIMLNVKVAEVRANLLPYFPLGFLFLGLFYLDLGVFSLNALPSDFEGTNPAYVQWYRSTCFFGPLEALGFVLYTYYPLYLFGAGLLLLLAMIGAILLTLHRGVGVRRQDVSFQNRRDWVEALQRVNLFFLL